MATVIPRESLADTATPQVYACYSATNKANMGFRQVLAIRKCAAGRKCSHYKRSEQLELVRKAASFSSKASSWEGVDCEWTNTNVEGASEQL